jgi:hypothetical protein
VEKRETWRRRNEKEIKNKETKKGVKNDITRDKEMKRKKAK